MMHEYVAHRVPVAYGYRVLVNDTRSLELSLGQARAGGGEGGNPPHYAVWGATPPQFPFQNRRRGAWDRDMVM